MRATFASVAACALALGLAAGCKCSDKSVTPAASASAAAPIVLPPLNADSWLVELTVSGFAPASVSVPLGAREPRPVLIALHGASDRPEWQCGTWTGITRARGFVLCPRGVARKEEPERFGWASNEQVEKELRAALAALKARFGRHVAGGPVVLAAFDSGVPPAIAIAKQEPSFFSRLVLVGVGPDLVNAGVAGVLAKGGGRRVMLVCSDPACKRDAERYDLFIHSAGIENKLVDAGDFGRLLDGRVSKAIESELPWLVNGDPLYTVK